MTALISVNGRILPADLATVSAFDRGFMLGDGLFETLRVADGMIWYFDRHLNRLAQGAERLGMTYPSEIRQWTKAVVNEAFQGGVSVHTLRLTLTRGGSVIPDLTGDNAANPVFAAMVYEAPLPYPSHAQERGITASIAAAPLNERAITSGLKTTNYLETIVAVRAARHAGYDDTIFLDTHGFVAEGATSNIFVVVNGALVTPSVVHGILPGITRAVVLEIAHAEHIPVAEREVRLEELLNADEAFLTSSVRGIIPLVRVGHDVIANGSPGAITHHIMRLYDHAPSRQ